MFVSSNDNMKNSEKLSDQVTNKIKQDIAQHKYKTGEKIPAEPELMKLYEVGRSTIREAIKILAMTGILRVQQGSGTFVNNGVQYETIDQRLRRDRFFEINGVRKILGKKMGKVGRKKKTEKDIKDIKKRLQK